jgi:hypothetical protein
MSNFPKVSDLGSGHLSPEAIMMYELFARVGNSTDGQAYQRVREVDETKLIDIVGADIYIGVAIPGTANSAANWKISRINTNNPITIYWADSSTLYNKVWNSRSSYTYA